MSDHQNMKAENLAQAEAFRRMHGPALKLIAKHAKEFRAIIDDMELNEGRVATADDLVYLASEHADRDLTKENNQGEGYENHDAYDDGAIF